MGQHFDINVVLILYLSSEMYLIFPALKDYSYFMPHKELYAVICSVSVELALDALCCSFHHSKVKSHTKTAVLPERWACDTNVQLVQFLKMNKKREKLLSNNPASCWKVKKKKIWILNTHTHVMDFQLTSFEARQIDIQLLKKKKPWTASKLIIEEMWVN